MAQLHSFKYSLFSIALICPILLCAQSSTTPTVTTINLNNAVLQSPVKRLGMNLGAINFYDSGQMMKNLIVSNPGFEGGISQSMIQCSAGTATSCTDSISYSGWPADYWDGATYTFVYGTAIGRTGTVSTSTAPNSSTNQPVVFNFANSGVAPSAGDYMIVSKPMPGNAVDGWNYVAGGNGTIGTDTTDLPPDTQGKQALVMTAPASGDSMNITYYFDSTAGRTFLQLNGSYNLSFKAKTTNAGGSGSIYVNLQRLASQVSGPYIDQTIPLTNQWQTFNIPFTASETGDAVGSVRLIFATSETGQSITANQVYLDDTSLVQTNTDPTNTTVFRDTVVNTLKQLNPGVVRFWFNQLGETLDNLLAPQLGRQRSAYSAYAPDVNAISYGLGEFLQLLQTVGSGNNASSTPPEPWIVLPMTLSDAEASNVIDYLAGPTTTKYGAIRAAAGQTAPWTTVFPKIHLEFSDEAWNAGLYGGNMQNQQAYGTRAQNVFAIMRNNANYNAAAFDLMINGQATSIGNETLIQAYCNNNDTFASQPYMMLSPNDPFGGQGGTLQTSPAAIETLFGSTFAEAEAFVTPSGTAEGISNGFVLQNLGVAQSSGRPVQYAVTETNIDPFAGTLTQSDANSYTTSVGAGLALIDSMLQNMRVGVLTQNIFELTGYQYYPYNEPSLFLYGSVVDMGVTNLQRPQFLGEEVANNAIGSNTTMLQTVHTGLDPTWNQPYANSVQLNNAHYLQSFAFTNGSNYSLIIFNTNRSAPEQVNFAGANVPGGTVQMTVLTSANITDTNEHSSVVAPVTSTLTNFNAAAGMTLPPFSMTTLKWSAPAISNVTVSNVTGTSATISWTVNDATATSAVNYGTTTAYGSQSATMPAGSTTQSVTLTGLTAGTQYNYSVTATSGTGATSSSVNSTFGTSASFSLSAQASISLAQGQSATVPVLVSDTNGYTGPVNLAVTGLPTGATGTFQTTAGSSSLALTVPSSVLAGTYPLTITGTAGGTSETAPLSLNVSGASQAQTISFTAIPNQYVGATVTAVATASSGLTVTFSVVPNGNCTSSGTNGSTIKFLNPGNCGIIASQAGNSTYEPASQGQIVVINSALPPQTITFTSSNADQTVASTLALTATASSGLAVSFSSSTPAVCTVAGTTASFIASGTCTIVAAQPGNSSYAAAPNVPLTINVHGEPQTITFPTIATQTAGNTLTLSASSTSNLTVSFASTTQSVCSVSGTTLTLNSAGNCNITASQAGNSQFAAAIPVPQTFAVNAAPVAQTITFPTITAANVGTPLTLTATASSGLAVSYVSTTMSVCTVSGTTATFAETGTCSITASQAGNSSYLAATPVAQSFAVNAALKSQTISFGAIAPQYTGTPLTLTGLASSSSGLTISFASTTTSICTVSGTTSVSAQFLAQGTCTIVASQAGNSTYAAATPVAQNITVNPTAYNQTITFNAIAAQTVGTNLTLTATATSNLTVSFASTTASVCTVSGATATFIAAGTCSITASQAGNGSYQAATPVARSFTVNPGAQTISFGSISTQTAGTALTLNATASSGLTVSYASSTTGVCTVSGSTATLLGAGTCSITASQAGNSNYAAATPVSQSFTVQAAGSSNGTTTMVSLASAANIYGIFNNGSTVTNGGLDTSDYAYSANLLGTGLTFQGIPYSFGAAGTVNAASSTTIKLPAGNYSTLNFLGTAIYGNQTAQTFTVTYTDNTTATFTQSMSDWGAAQNYTGETVASSMSYRLTPGGAQSTGQSWNLYAYSFALNKAKTVQSLTLPNVRNVTVLAITLSSSQAAQTISFGTVTAQTVGTPLTLSATASSGLPVTYASSTTSICSVSGSTATFVAAGTCTITASQAGNSVYTAAASVTQSFTVSAEAQTITFNSIPSQSVGGTLTVSATASSGLPVTFTVVPNGNCSISGNVVTFLNVGNCGVIANQAGNSAYAAAPAVGQIIVVNNSQSQTITFAAPASQASGTTEALNATASSGLSVSFASTTSGICTVSGSTASLLAAGTCTIVASQSGNNVYGAATPVSRSFTVTSATSMTATVAPATLAAGNYNAFTVSLSGFSAAPTTLGLGGVSCVNISGCTVNLGGSSGLLNFEFGFVTSTSASLDVYVSNSILPGTYAIPITLGSTTIGTFHLTVPAAGFTISTNSSFTLARGNGGTLPVTITPANGFSGSVSLSLVGLPSGASDTFLTNSATSSTLVIYVPSTVTAGTYKLTINGSSGSASASTNVTFVVQ